MAEKLFLLVALHFLADFALQSDTMAREKHPSSDTPLQKAVPWYHWLTAHAFIHGLMVWTVTRSVPLALTEVVLHFAIDYGKCTKRYGIWADQGMHLVAKVLYALFL